METGIFIRGQVDGKWGSYDIGDLKLPDEAVAEWLATKEGNVRLLKRLVMCLLGRRMTVVK